MSFGAYFPQMYFMSTILLKENIDVVRVTQFQLTDIRDTTHPSHKKLLNCVMNYIICGGEIKIWNYKSGRIS